MNLIERLNDPTLPPLFTDHGFGHHLAWMGIEGVTAFQNIANPYAVKQVHWSVLPHADIILTNTFTNNTSLLQRDGVDVFQHPVYDLGRLAVEHAHDVIETFNKGEKVYVFGSVGPLAGTLKCEDPKDGLEFDQIRAEYRASIRPLLDGCDAIVLETMFSAANARIALEEILQVMEEQGKKLPIFVCYVTGFKPSYHALGGEEAVERAGRRAGRRRRRGGAEQELPDIDTTAEMATYGYRTMWGNSSADILRTLTGESNRVAMFRAMYGDMGRSAKNQEMLGDDLFPYLSGIGFNCGPNDEDFVDHNGGVYAHMAATELNNAYEQLGLDPKIMILYPNAGIAGNSITQDHSHVHAPEQMASWVKYQMDQRARIIGACCVSTPQHIEAIKREGVVYHNAMMKAQAR